MTLLDATLGRFGLRVKAGGAVERPGYLYSETEYGGMHVTLTDEFDEAAYQRRAMRSAWVYSDINLLSRKAGQARFNVFERTGEEIEPVNNHDFERKMRRPNPLMSGSFLLRYTMMWFNLSGNAYWWLGVNDRGELQEIWPLPSRDVEPVKGKKGSDEVLAGYRYTPMGYDELIDPAMVCHFRLANPWDPIKGLSPLEALRTEVAGDAAMKKWNVNFFDKRNAIPTVIISLPQTTSKPDFARIRDQIYKEFGGTERRAMVTRAGDVKAEVIGLSHIDMDFLGGINLNQRTIDRVFGFPEGYWSMEASRNNAATAELILLRDTVQPTLDYFAEEVDAQVIDRHYKDEDLTIQATNLVPEDRELKVEEFKVYAPVMTIDEAREEIGKTALGGMIGSTPYGLMSAVGQMLAQGLPVGDLPAPEIPSPAKSDLVAWQKVALREIAEHRSPASREFFSSEIPGHVKATILARLTGVEDAEDVRAVFWPYIQMVQGWNDYP